MRKEFSKWIESYVSTHPKVVFLSGDLGFMALEGVQSAAGDRFVNAGVSEQNMVSVAAGLAQQGLLPICYSIAPFAVFRPYEQLRLDVAIHRLCVKVVGNGGGYGYGIMGASHHALEDIAVLSCLPNFSCIIPLCDPDVESACGHFIDQDYPGYLRLGVGKWPEFMGPLAPFHPVRQLVAAAVSTRVTVVGMGPVLLGTLKPATECGLADVFCVGEIPIRTGLDAIVESVTKSKTLLVVEEHAERGGLGDHLASRLAKSGVSFRLIHRHALGYPAGLYGNQQFHQRESGLDESSLSELITQVVSS